MSVKYIRINFIVLVLMLSCLPLLASKGVEAQTRVIAHRGYWKTPGSAQNSITSLSKADSIGAYGSEFDIWTVDAPEVMIELIKRGVDYITTNEPVTLQNLLKSN